MLEISKAQLDKLMEERGIDSYQALSEKAKAQGVSLAFSTIYQLASGGNWRRSTLEALCEVLRCEPGDLVPGLTGYHYTHDAPQPAEEFQATAA
jgi:DNA-binding Xre family transcriptional regulator